MSDLRPNYVKINLGGKDYGMLFSLNAVDEIQDRFDIPISNLKSLFFDDEKKRAKNIKAVLTTLINQAIEDSESGEKHVTETFVGRKALAKDVNIYITAIYKAFAEGIPEPEDDDPNPQSE